jgi:hypothetical protein
VERVQRVKGKTPRETQVLQETKTTKEEEEEKDEEEEE